MLPAAPLPPAQAPAAQLDAYGDPLPPGAVARLGTVRLRHEGNATTLAFSPDGKTLGGICHGRLYVWDPATGKEIYRVHDDRADLHPLFLEFSLDGRTLFTASHWNRELQFRVAATGRLTRTQALRVPDDLGLSPYYLSPDRRTLAVQAASCDCRLVDVNTGRLLGRVGDAPPGAPLVGHRRAAFAPDGKTLAIALPDGPVQLWRVPSGPMVCSVAQPDEALTRSLDFSPDGRLLASATQGQILLSDAATGRLVARLPATGIGPTDVLRFTPDGRKLVSVDLQGHVRVWDIATRTLRRVSNSGLWANALAVSPDGRTVAVGCGLSAARLWDVAAGRNLPVGSAGHDDDVTALAFAPDGRVLATGSYNEQTRLWDTRSWRELRLLPSASGILGFTPDGRRLMSVAVRVSAQIWDPVTGVKVASISPNSCEGMQAALSGDGTVLVTAPEQGIEPPGGPLRTWDAATGHRLSGTYVPHGVREMFLPSRRREVLMADGGGGLCWCDLDTGKESLLKASEPEPLMAFVASRDEALLLCGTAAGGVTLWELSTGRRILKMKTQSPTSVAAFSPDGRLAASADGSVFFGEPVPRRIRVWNLAQGTPVHVFEEFGSDVRSLAFSPDGTRLVSGMRNGTVLVWDLTAVVAATHPAAQSAPPADVAALWADLADDDAGRAYRAGWVLADAPAAAIRLLRERLRPAPSLDEQRLRQLIGDLDSDRFAIRDEASRALAELRPQADPGLRIALAKGPAAEVRRRLEAVLTAPRTLSRETVRALRALQVLERIGTPEARRILKRLAKGSARAPLSAAAGGALERLEQRAAAR